MNTVDSRHTETRHLNCAMHVRRWLLILAAPVILFLTIASVMQWRLVWQSLIP